MSNQDIQQQLAVIDNLIEDEEKKRGIVSDETIEAALTQLRQKKVELTAQLKKFPRTNYEANVKGSGVVAQGAGTTAIGARGVNVGGSVGGNIVTGDKNRVTQVGGDQVKGNKTSVGDITRSSGVAIGRESQAHMQHGVSGEELKALFRTVHQKVQNRPADPDVAKAEIVEQVQKIEAETTLNEQPNEGKLERWIKNLANMAPDIVDVMAVSLAGPVAGSTAVLRKIIAKVKSERDQATG